MADTDITTEQMMAFGRQVLEQQPFSQLLGTQLVQVSLGHCTLRLPLRPELSQQYGFAHGGVVSYMADNTLTFAGASVLQQLVVTAEFKINYLRPAQGLALVARAEAVQHGRTQAVCRCEIWAEQADGSEKLCAIALGTIAVHQERAS